MERMKSVPECRVLIFATQVLVGGEVILISVSASDNLAIVPTVNTSAAEAFRIAQEQGLQLDDITELSANNYAQYTFSSCGTAPLSVGCQNTTRTPVQTLNPVIGCPNSVPTSASTSPQRIRRYRRR